MVLVLLFGAPISQAATRMNEHLKDNDVEMVSIDGGRYTALYREEGKVKQITVAPFWLDKFLVTNQQFLNFTQIENNWSKANIKPIFADQTYLQQFDHQNIADIAQQPVVNVSWFSAMAYCKANGKRLPTLDEWEFAARASATQLDGTKSVEFRDKILSWYSKPVGDALADVTNTDANYWGVHGMHGVVWELVRDFNTALVTGESRGDTALDKQLFCGAGASSSVDPSDYAAFMRYALRSSYSSSYTLSSLGFRCARDQ